MNDRLTALVQAGDTTTLAAMIARGELSGLKGADKGDLPRLAASLGQTEVLRLLCARCHAVALDEDEQGRDVLHAACQSGNRAAIAFAVEVLGFDPLRGDRNGVTPFDLAAQAANRAGYDYLVQRLGFTLQEGYRNPVRRGFYPDPSVVRVGEDYYMVNSTFTLFPCLPVSHSRDLVHWETVGHAIERLEWSRLEGLPGGFGYWAPDISYHKGRFWVVATLRLPTPPFRCQIITCAENPAGPWREPDILPVDGIDPSLFPDVDGRRYMLTNPGAQLMEISEEGHLLGQPEMIYFGSSRVKSEGPHLLFRDGWYYLFQAEGGTGEHHTETVARSRHLRGPYEPCPFNPILGWKRASSPIRRSGHGKPVQTPAGDWHMLYLCTRPVKGRTLLGRETGLDPLTWTADGWPMVNALQGPSCFQRIPMLTPCASDPVPDDPADLRSGWLSPRNDPRRFARMDGNGLILTASGQPAEVAPASILIQRQQEAAFTQQATVDAAAMPLGGTAGLTGYYDEHSFYVYGLRREADGWRLILWEQAGDQLREQTLRSLPAPAATLRIIGHSLTRTLQLRENDGWTTLASLRADYLTDEGITIGKRFTGATLGVAALSGAIPGGEARFTDMTLLWTGDQT